MKVSKLLVMALVILAVITMSLNVHAGTNELKAYVNDIHNINNMVFELTDSQKTVVLNYISTLDDATADAVMNDIIAAENLVRNTGATSIAQMSVNTKKEVINLGKSAADKAGLILTVDTASNTFTLTKKAGGVLVSGSADALIKYYQAPANGTSAATPAGTTTGSTLLYTGADYAVYAFAVLAIVAVAVVVKKRA